VKAVVEIYTGHVDFKHHFHTQICFFQAHARNKTNRIIDSNSNPGDEAQYPRVVCP
jgi:hypothetical protein